MKLEPMDEAFFRLLLQMNQIKIDKLAPELKTHELAIFYIIAKNTDIKGGAYVSEIADLLNIPVSGVSRILRRLENDLMYIRRTPDPSDRRNTIVSFTKEGKENYERHKSHALALATRIFNYLTKEEQVKYLELSDRLYKAFETEFSKLENKLNNDIN